jgi:hypothetical protein
VDSGSQCLYEPEFEAIRTFDLVYNDEFVGICEDDCTSTIDCVTFALKRDSVAQTITCTLYSQQFSDTSFFCSDLTPATTETDVYLNGCPTTSLPGRRDLSHLQPKVKRMTTSDRIMMKRQSSSNEVSGSGFDAGSAAKEKSFTPSISNDSPYYGLPSFSENIAVALTSSVQGENSTSGTNVSSTYTTIDGETFLVLYDTSKSVQLVALDSGALTLSSFGAQNAGALFGAIGSDIVVDSEARYFVYFPDAVTKKGVSSLHMVGPNSVPKGSEIIVLVEFPTSVGNIYAPVDTKGNPYLLAWCNIDFGSGPTPKVFLVEDYSTGLKTLTDPDLVYTIIGGVVVGDCHAVDLTSDLAPDVLSS